MKRGTESSGARAIESEAAAWVARRDAGLDADQARELERWLNADPRHVAAFRFYDATWSALAQPFRAGTGAALEQQLSRMAVRRTRRRIIGVAASLLVLFALGVGGHHYSRRPSPSMTSSAVVVIPTRQALQDGSTLECRPDSHVTTRYTDSERRVVLHEGEAYFSVRQDARRAFVVEVGGIEVRAVGTAFSVQKSATAVQVLVTQGEVAVEKTDPREVPDGRAAPTPVATVEAGSCVVVGVKPAAIAPQVTAVSDREIEQLLAWRTPLLEFTRTPLAEAVALLNRHGPTSVRFEISDPAVRAMRVSGVFRADNSEGFILLLEGAFGIRAERSGDAVILRRAE